MSLADIHARAQARIAAASPKARAARYAASEKARRLSDLKQAGYVIPLSEWLGHNNGPDWDDWALFRAFCWKTAHEKAWKAPTMEIGIRRAKKAAALGLSYRQYTLEILERGRYLNEDTLAALSGKKRDDDVAH